MEELRIAGWLSQPQASSIKGRLIFAEGQVFSKVASQMLLDLRRRAVALLV